MSALGPYLKAKNIIKRFLPRRVAFNQTASNIVLQPYRAIYVAIPKAACTTLKTVFARRLDLKIRDNVHFRIKFPTARISELSTRYSEHFKFCFVRNPWDRVVSCYADKISSKDTNNAYFRNGVEINFLKYGDLFYGDMPFDEFVRAIAKIPDEDSDIHFKSQYTHIVDKNGELVVDFIGKFERLQPDFEAVCARIGMEGATLPHLNRTEHTQYRDYYTEQLRRQVSERYESDIRRFGYEF